MGLLGNVFDNPAIKNAAFGQLKKLIKSENLGLIVVRLNQETDELEIDMYKPGEAVISIHATTAPDQTNLLTETTVANADNQDS